MAEESLAQIKSTIEIASADASAIQGNFRLDEAVIEVIRDSQRPQNLVSKYLWHICLVCYCSRNSVNQDGKPSAFFLKCVDGENGRQQLKGEFHAMSELYKTNPRIVPKPTGWGQYRNSLTSFFLSEYVNIDDKLPDPAKLGVLLADLHKTSVSPTGKFGFFMTTFDGRLPQTTDWDSSWTSYFAKLLAGILKLDVEINGPWPELEEATAKVILHVVPRLLNALEADGRTIKPSLIHGDLWEGNIGTDFATGDIYIFDCCSYYAHNEMELGIWRTEHHRMKAKAYRKEYLRNFPLCEPVDEWDDRNRLYCTKTKLMYSAHVPGSQVRGQALDDFKFLLEKYPPPK